MSARTFEVHLDSIMSERNQIRRVHDEELVLTGAGPRVVGSERGAVAAGFQAGDFAEGG